VALDDIDLQVPEGAIVGVIGKSGAGKSTLIRLINGLERPSSGRVLVNGTDVTALGERDLREARRSIGMIFQHFNLLSSRTAFENIALPLEIAGFPKSEIAGVLEGGRIVEQGTTYDIFANPRHETTRRFVGSVVGGNVPEWLRAKLRPERLAGDSAVLHVAFVGGAADQPVLSRLARNLGVDVNILHGQVETIAGHPFGSLFISVPAEPQMLREIIAELRAGQNTVERLGYVS